jgi:hypothetical protein
LRFLRKLCNLFERNNHHFVIKSIYTAFLNRKSKLTHKDRKIDKTRQNDLAQIKINAKIRKRAKCIFRQKSDTQRKF